MMNAESFKHIELAKNIQSVLIDQQGMVIDSDDVLIKLGKDHCIFEDIDVFIGMSEVFETLEPDQEFKLDCIETSILGKASIYDFVVKRTAESDLLYLLLIYDLGDVYNRVVSLRQERNEARMYADQLAIAHQKLKETQLQLVSSERLAAVGLLAAGMSHEINNPLNYILNGTALLKQKMGEGQDDDKGLGVLFEAVELGAYRIREVVSRLKVFDESSHKKLEYASLHDIVEHTLRLIEPQLSTKLAIVREYSNEMVDLKCRPAKLSQLFMNILTNAARFTTGEDQPQVVIKTEKMGQFLEVKISDNGVGIESEIIDRIFEPFFTTERMKTGKGLGLSMAKIIVKEHQGNLEVHSLPGKGATFTIKLPIN